MSQNERDRREFMAAIREVQKNIRANNDPRQGGPGGVRVDPGFNRGGGPAGGGGYGGVVKPGGGGGRFGGPRVGPPIRTVPAPAPAPGGRPVRGGPPPESSYPGQDVAPYETGGPPPWSNAGGNGQGQGPLPSSFPNFGQGKGGGGGGGGRGQNFAPAAQYRGVGGAARRGGAIPMRLPLGRAGTTGRRRARRGIPMRKF